MRRGQGNIERCIFQEIKGGIQVARQIRRAQRADADFLAKIILMAGRAHVRKGIWDVILGGTDDENRSFLSHLTVTGEPHLFHHSFYHIAEVDREQAAALGGYDPKTSGYSALREAMPETIRESGRNDLDQESLDRMARVLPCIPESLEEAWIIDSVATLPEYRGLGLAGELLESILERGRQLGFLLAQINIYIGNTPAQRLYEKHGFTIVDENRCTDFEQEIGSPGMARMTRAR
jgi:ribosomal protein S18 acetylase RimI-like enzyme